MSESDVVVTDRRRIPPIWILPIVAALLGLWMLYYNISNQGPLITVTFLTAEGIQAGKTKIKARNVDLGVVESVTLGEDLEHVVVTAQLEPSARGLVNADTLFWVVRARVDAGGVSGLGTLLSGGYIELAPGSSDASKVDFVGLENPPITAAGTPGAHVFLVTRTSGSVGTGDPVLFRGFTVGRVEGEEFDVESELMRYRAFIHAPYDGLLRTTTRFWNRSGIDISATAQGVSVRTGSLQTLVTGGVEFGTDPGYGPGAAVENGMEFTLFPGEDEAHEDPFNASVPFVVMFEQSLRGLNAGAPVELRGLQVGRVERIMLDEMSASGLPGPRKAVPVLIRLEPGRLRWADDESGETRVRESLQDAVHEGLFATLQTGSLLTGQLVVALDFFLDDEPGEMDSYAGLPTLPTKSSGLAQIEQKVVAVLDQVQNMPLGEIGHSARSALEELTRTLQTASETLASLNAVLEQEDTAQLPDELTASLEQLRATLGSFSEGSVLYDRLDGTVLELQRTLKSVEDLVRGIEDQPNSLIFTVPRKDDPEPGGRQ